MMMEITNLILKRLYQSGLDVDLDLSLDSTVANAVQVMINVKPIHFNDFSIFYGTKDKKINYSSIFEVENKDDLKAYELFNKDKGIFGFYIVEEEDNFIHLFGEVELDDIVDIDEHIRINDSFIDDIIKYLSEEHELTNYLTKLEQKGE